VAFGFDEKHNKKAFAVPGKSVRITIRLDHPLKSKSEAQEVLNRIFFPNVETSDFPRPTFWRPDQKVASEIIYKVGRDNVHPPVVRYAPDPDYSEAARKHKHQGTVILRVVVDKAGTVSRITIETAIGMGLDENAVEKVKNWKFEPAIRDGQPVAAEVNVEVQFNLY
jgi:TonB family protein